MWAYARGAFEPEPAVVYDFCAGRRAQGAGRGGKYVVDFLKGWSGMLLVDDYAGYDAALRIESRVEAGFMAHSRRKFAVGSTQTSLSR